MNPVLCAAILLFVSILFTFLNVSIVADNYRAPDEHSGWFVICTTAGMSISWSIFYCYAHYHKAGISIALACCIQATWLTINELVKTYSLTTNAMITKERTWLGIKVCVITAFLWAMYFYFLNIGTTM